MVSFKGNAVALKGNFPSIGKRAPSFQLAAQDLKEVSLDSLGNKKKLLNIFPSLDTAVCALSVRAFYEQCSAVPNLVVANISMDLPFAAGRFCKNEGLVDIVTLSAFRSSFPDDYGVRIAAGPLAGLCSRAVLLLSETNEILYSELVEEITHEPNYDAALNALMEKKNSF